LNGLWPRQLIQMTRFVALGPRKLRVKDVHVWKSIATEIPDLKGRAEAG